MRFFFAGHSRASGRRFSTAELVIHLDLALLFCCFPWSQSFHSSCGGAGHFLLKWPRESNQREATPNVAPSGHPALRVRSRAPGFARRTSLYVRKLACILHAILRTLPPPASRDSRGPRVEQRAPARRSKEEKRKKRQSRSPRAEASVSVDRAVCIKGVT